jgi:hypothetical protein
MSAVPVRGLCRGFRAQSLPDATCFHAWARRPVRRLRTMRVCLPAVQGGESVQRYGARAPMRSRRLEVHKQLEALCLLDRKLARERSLENPVHIAGRPATKLA